MMDNRICSRRVWAVAIWFFEQNPMAKGAFLSKLNPRFNRVTGVLIW
jgi:hypothetical protein